MQRDHIYTTYDIGKMTGTDPTTVHKWIDRGLLKGFRTPGGHRRVTADALRAFMIAHGMPIPAEVGNASRIKVLLVDDELALLRSWTRGVKKARPGWDVESSSDGYQALLMMASFQPNAVLLDIVMPGLDGSAVTKSVKAHSPSVHVLACSGRVGSEIEKKAIEAGASAFLKKPVSPEAIVEAVERACGILAPLEAAKG